MKLFSKLKKKESSPAGSVQGAGSGRLSTGGQSKEAQAKVARLIWEAEQSPSEVVDLSYCQLEKVPDQVHGICTTGEKKALLLNNNELRVLDQRCKTWLPLTRLELRHNQLTELPRELVALVALRVLDLQGNLLTGLPAEISNLVALETLNLKDNRISRVPVSITELPHLQTMDLEGNPLVDPPLHVALRGTEAIMVYLVTEKYAKYRGPLKSVYLHQTTPTVTYGGVEGSATSGGVISRKESKVDAPRRLEQVLWEAENSPSEVVDLSGLGLDKVPEQAFKICVDEKQALLLNNNHLTELAGSFRLLTHIRRLELQHNRLSRLPDDLAEMENLRVLNLQGNQFRNLPRCVLRLRLLQTLDLSCNDLQQIPTALCELRYLDSINIAGNEGLANVLPPHVIKAGGRALMQHLCNGCGRVYVPPLYLPATHSRADVRRRLALEALRARDINDDTHARSMLDKAQEQAATTVRIVALQARLVELSVRERHERSQEIERQRDEIVDELRGLLRETGYVEPGKAGWQGDYNAWAMHARPSAIAAMSSAEPLLSASSGSTSTAVPQPSASDVAGLQRVAYLCEAIGLPEHIDTLMAHTVTLQRLAQADDTQLLGWGVTLASDRQLLLDAARVVAVDNTARGKAATIEGSKEASPLYTVSSSKAMPPPAPTPIITPQPQTPSQNQASSLPPGEGSSSRSECVVCLCVPIQVVLLDCGHACVCLQCSAPLTVCPLCRATVQSRLQIYIP